MVEVEAGDRAIRIASGSYDLVRDAPDSRLLALPGMAERTCKVGQADDDGVQVVYGENAWEILHSRGGFDHGDDQRVRKMRTARRAHCRYRRPRRTGIVYAGELDPTDPAVEIARDE